MECSILLLLLVLSYLRVVCVWNGERKRISIGHSIPFDSMTCIIDIENSHTGVPVFHLDSLQNSKDTPMQDVSMAMIILKTKASIFSIHTLRKKF